MEKTEFRKLKHGFTLIEMLAVCAIIAVLAGLVIPVVGYAKTQAKKAKAKEEMNNLRVALRAFYTEYGYWPRTTSWTDLSALLNGNIKPYDGTTASSWCLTNNIHNIHFMEFKREALDSTGRFIDPWGTNYCVMMDNGLSGIGRAVAWTDTTLEDGLVLNPNGGNIQSAIIVYSFGPDKTDNAGADTSDDVKTWTN